ncbi:Similar to hypothetical protein AOL_s00004g290 [Arthrobotrys oligospora ATCC 24927]; acc. no. EGX54257 [Pyronema omphalodes CBS 100304]|uniref:Rhodopsin domain-containing protein n=1 Tax=Pyronema omphalodes (strain CBS 100304) TaxID=1076935 RepID=U4L8F6_PYROM|nr:Similar to hypothetical protein AOL_s00004g290 [Arthrobotrys oligospora ATCC 24927]; acc. no. EGX54257 [Pyronema omphalodes CBS 100304]
MNTTPNIPRPPPLKGIPNFTSAPLFGRTSSILFSAQLLVVAAFVSSILRIFSRRLQRTRFKFDDFCALAAFGLLIVNTLLLVEFNFLGRKSFSDRAGKENGPMKEARRRGDIKLGLKISLAFEVVYLYSCTRRLPLVYTSGLSNIITNTLVLSIPIPLLLRAQLRPNQRLGVLFLYLFGALVILFSALRFVTQLLNVSLPQAMGWSQMELSLALLLACAPMAVKVLAADLYTIERERSRGILWGPGPGPQAGSGQTLGKEGYGAHGGAHGIDLEKEPKTAALDTPTFVKRLMKERDEIIRSSGMNSPIPNRRSWEHMAGVREVAAEPTGPTRVSFDTRAGRI